MVASLQLRQQVRQRHLSQTRPSDCRVAPTPASRYMLTVWLMCRLSRTRLGVKAMFDLELEVSSLQGTTSEAYHAIRDECSGGD